VVIGATVSIVRENSEPLWPDMIDHVRPDPEWDMRIAFIERGMQSGGVSVMLAIRLANGGPWVITETSLAIFDTALSAARGAFPEAFQRRGLI
jgi:hypothetical protein